MPTQSNPYDSIELYELVETAYRKLKQDIYFDHVDHFLRARLAWFEGTSGLEEKLRMIATGLSYEMQGNEDVRSWLSLGNEREGKGIRFRIFPKRVILPDEDVGKDSSGRFISNTREAQSYNLSKVDYLIDAPIHVHVISVLWCMIVGRKLDFKLDLGCFGNRLDLDKSPRYDKSSKLFKLFYQQYNQWRDDGMQAAKSVLDRGESVAVISLDVKECYYHLSVPWEQLFEHEAVKGDPLAEALTRFLQIVHETHRKNIQQFCRCTHSSEVANAEGLPIGLPSSRVLANWIFSDLDKEIRERIRPEYYGRYVDDMLIVIKDPLAEKGQESVEAILKTHFIDKGLMMPVKGKGISDYMLETPDNAFITKEKLAVYYFDKRHSRAGLNNILDRIQKTASEFRFLPHDDQGRELDQCAFDILYDGSINKLSSITGISENSTELSKYLARRLVENRLTSSALDKTVREQLGRFWRGRNIFDFCRLWEKTFSLLLVKNQHSELNDYISRMKSTIKRLQWGQNNEHVFVCEELNEKLQADLFEYLNISIAIPLSLLGGAHAIKNKKLARTLGDENEYEFNIWSTAFHFRTSNLMRHQLVSWPLLNYTEYSGPLIHFNSSTISAGDEKLGLSKYKKKWSPRFLHFDERSVFRFLQQMMYQDKKMDFSMKELLDEYKETNPDFPVSITRETYPKSDYDEEYR